MYIESKVCKLCRAEESKFAFGPRRRSALDVAIPLLTICPNSGKVTNVR